MEPINIEFTLANIAMKHLGLFERDHTQRSENLSLQVVLVGAPTNERD